MTLLSFRYAIDKGIVKQSNEMDDTIVKIHCPAGLVQARVSHDLSASFISSTAFVLASDVNLTLANGKSVKVGFKL